MTTTAEAVVEDLAILAEVRRPLLFTIYGVYRPEVVDADPKLGEQDEIFGWGMAFPRAKGVFFYEEYTETAIRGDSIDDVLTVLRRTADVDFCWFDETWRLPRNLEGFLPRDADGRFRPSTSSVEWRLPAVE